MVPGKAGSEEARPRNAVADAPATSEIAERAEVRRWVSPAMCLE